jgi:P-type Cu+ transporter
MGTLQALGLIVAIGATGGLGWFFFGPRAVRQAELDDGVQVVRVAVKGGYSPDLIQVTQGVPVRLLFDRQESGDCSSHVVFPDFGVNQGLPAFATTAVELVPTQPGEFGFACGMNMIRGRLTVLPGPDAATDGASGTGQRVRSRLSTPWVARRPSTVRAGMPGWMARTRRPVTGRSRSRTCGGGWSGVAC